MSAKKDCKKVILRRWKLLNVSRCVERQLALSYIELLNL